MDYFARLVQQSQLRIGAEGPAPSADTTRGFDNAAPTGDVVEIDAMHEPLPEATVAHASPPGAHSPPDPPAPSVLSLSQPPPAVRHEPESAPARMPVDDIQSGHPAHPTPIVKTDATDSRAASTRVLREVIEWIAAGPQPTLAPNLKPAPTPGPADSSPAQVSIERPEERTPDAREETAIPDAVPAKSAHGIASKDAPVPAARRVPAKPVPAPARMDVDTIVPPRAASLMLAQEQPLSVEPIAEMQETFEVSIGNLSLHIEAPARPAPTPPAPVAAAAPAPVANAGGRLQRRYLRP